MRVQRIAQKIVCNSGNSWPSSTSDDQGKLQESLLRGPRSHSTVKERTRRPPRVFRSRVHRRRPLLQLPRPRAPSTPRPCPQFRASVLVSRKGHSQKKTQVLWIRKLYAIIWKLRCPNSNDEFREGQIRNGWAESVQRHGHSHKAVRGARVGRACVVERGEPFWVN